MTFDALDPYILCIPQMMYRNTGIPIAILVSQTVKSSLYSLFFEALKKMDIEKPN